MGSSGPVLELLSDPEELLASVTSVVVVSGSSVVDDPLDASVLELPATVPPVEVPVDEDPLELDSVAPELPSADVASSPQPKAKHRRPDAAPRTQASFDDMPPS